MKESEPRGRLQIPHSAPPSSRSPLSRFRYLLRSQHSQMHTSSRGKSGSRQNVGESIDFRDRSQRELVALAVACTRYLCYFTHVNRRSSTLG
ncbi:hypothetical protein F2P81_021928 [Scophthalmus maximus]|uniref:Uncharacterized protein n=1 Tax=Scophthalmus maximus TaxID=52904 RepID=A0A6A4RX69_SCOMX|nr:hypothetical protein F2P81_021928 [Scophthalmus maximus]